MKSFNITGFIKITLIALLVLWVMLLIKPFIGILAWAVILAIALSPVFKWFTEILGIKRKGILTKIFSTIILGLLLIPTYLLTSSIIQSIDQTVSKVERNELQIAPPSIEVKDWPLIGPDLYKNWQELAADSRNYLNTHQEFIKKLGSEGAKKFAGVLGTILSFVLSTIIAIILMTNADNAYSNSVKFMNKLYADNKGQQLLLIARDTVRNVVKGILFVAILQAVLCFIGFKFFGIPAASIFAFVVLIAAIIGLPVTLVVLPTILIAFNMADDQLTAVIFTVYIIIVSLMDNVLKPILLAKGLKTPMVLILIGALGGVLLHGIIGLFIGTVLLAVMHQLYLAWIAQEDTSIKEDITLATVGLEESNQTDTTE